MQRARAPRNRSGLVLEPRRCVATTVAGGRTTSSSSVRVAVRSGPALLRRIRRLALPRGAPPLDLCRSRALRPQPSGEDVLLADGRLAPEHAADGVRARCVHRVGPDNAGPRLHVLTRLRSSRRSTQLAADPIDTGTSAEVCMTERGDRPASAEDLAWEDGPSVRGGEPEPPDVSSVGRIPAARPPGPAPDFSDETIPMRPAFAPPSAPSAPDLPSAPSMPSAPSASSMPGAPSAPSMCSSR